MRITNNILNEFEGILSLACGFKCRGQVLDGLLDSEDEKVSPGKGFERERERASSPDRIDP